MHCLIRGSYLFLPGFLGAKEDWDEVRAHLNSPSRAFNLGEPFPSPSKELILVGYSMGGRIALQMHPSKWKAVIVLGAHPGIAEENERKERRKIDEIWANRLENLPFAECLDLWYAQPLFATLKEHPCYPSILKRRAQEDPQRWAHILRLYSAGVLPPLSQLPSNLFFLYGAYDEKYKRLYQKLGLPAVEIPQSGHAAHLENPLGTAQAIEMCTLYDSHKT